MRQYLISLAIIAFALTLAGCVTCCIPNPDIQRVFFADVYDYYGNNSSGYLPTGIIGAWSSNSSHSDIVDPGIAFYDWYGPAPDGEWYVFKDDGYFEYVNMTTEERGRGGIYKAGAYTAANNSLTLHEINESWYPNSTMKLRKPGYKYKSIGDEHFTYRLQDNNTLVILSSTGNRTYYRLFK